MDEQNNFDIAVIGMAGRFPGANNIDELWQNLRAGVESITFFSDEELIESGIGPAVLKDPNYVKAAPILENPDLFDASFFKCSPREAEIMDPQQRLFLECAWEALEHAGYDADRYEGPIGIFAGASPNTYLLFSNFLHDLANNDLAIMIGNDKDFLTTRVSYKIDLKGPSVSVGTGCSTSLVAVHMACQSLLNEECDIALAGGVSVRVPHRAGYYYQRGNIVSPDGHCRAFDEKAQGTIFGSGVGIVVLKRLDAAIADGDCIHAIVKGSAVNNDGHSKVDYTAPSLDGQSKVIVEALENAGLGADTISYIEAHGTGTALGDPIEVAALTKAFHNYTDKKGFCAIGSVKTNIGHLDSAAGISGFIKTVMALKYKMIPPSLHFEKPNPEIDFQNSPFYVNSRLAEWQAPYPRRAGVSAFGVGGTNAHVILEEAPDSAVPGKSRPWQILPLSARTSTALETATANLARYLKENPALNLADVAYTLQVGRKLFDYRRTLVCKNGDDAVHALETPDSKSINTSFQEQVNRDIVFIFSGQGSQYVNMGLELYRNEPVFREAIDRCSEILQPHLGLDLREIIYPDEQDVEDATEKITQTYITQPALFTIEYALAKLWMAWGVHPQAFVGHSIGEYVAACLSGVFSLEDALSVVASRGRLIQELPGGSMLAVFLSEKELQPLLNENLSLAVINGPSLCVVSGEKEVIRDFEKQLTEKNIHCRNILTSHAFHSRMIELVLDAFTERVKQVRLKAPQVPFVSNVTGTWITSDEATSPDYWARHLRQTVRYSDCIEELLKEPNRVLLEVGPGSTFSTLVKQHPGKKKEQIILSSIRHPKEKASDTTYILNTLGQLWLAGIRVDWSGFYENENRHRLPLPTYPFERERYWSEATEKIKVGKSVSPGPFEELDEVAKSRQAYPVQGASDAGVDVTNNVEQTLANMWRETLGVKHVDLNDDFFDLGGTSLVAVSLFTEIEKVFGKKLPLAALIGAPTVRQLADVIRNHKWEGSWTSLVEMQPGNSKPPLFFIHAAGGNLLIYHDLIRHLGTEQPVYGLQAQGLDGEQPFHTRIEDMASQYVQEIQKIYPEGPYLLSGYCMGGTVALEIAQQLYAQNKKVALLVLLETYNFSNQPNALLDRIYYRIQQIDFHLRNFLLTDRKLTFLKEKVKVAWERKNVWLGAILSKLGLEYRMGNWRHSLVAEIWEACDRAAMNYVPEVYPGRITQFLPMKHYACFSGPELGWEKLAAGGLETCDLPVYPRGMLVEPFVPLLAEKLKACIQKALETEPDNRNRA